MTDGNSTVECEVSYRPAEIAVEPANDDVLQRLKEIPWTRVIVDALLVGSMLMASSKLVLPH